MEELRLDRPRDATPIHAIVLPPLGAILQIGRGGRVRLEMPLTLAESATDVLAAVQVVSRQRSMSRASQFGWRVRWHA